MINCKYSLSVVLGAVVLIFLPQTAHAVVPPDFIFNIGGQVMQVFSLLLILISASVGSLTSFFRRIIFANLRNKIVLMIIVILLIAGAVGISYWYALNQQQEKYNLWLTESHHQQMTASSTLIISDPNDQLVFGGAATNSVSIDKFVSHIEPQTGNKNIYFVEQYYRNIAEKKFESAYEMSKKHASYTTFKQWYQDIEHISLDKYVQIDNVRSSLELTLFEKGEATRYGVLMTLHMENGVPLNVESSIVRILSSQDTKQEVSLGSFFSTHGSSTPIISTNKEFDAILKSGSADYVILDAREDAEYENGHLQGGLHIRFADLKAGRWIELSNDKKIIVLCWSGIRGKEVAEFLRSKKLVASYLENGANGWVAYGGTWIGGIKFNDAYSEEQYRIVFSTNDVKKFIAQGGILIDSREPTRFATSHIPGSINISMFYTPSVDLNKVFSKVPANSKIITICDGYVNCFDAKITGLELEKRGHEFMGRYNQPWEY